jgi:predicted phosphoribosyltransferase
LVKQQEPKKIIVAVPVGFHTTIQIPKSTTGVNELICLVIPVNFKAVGQFYDQFNLVPDEVAILLLEQAVNAN